MNKFEKLSRSEMKKISGGGASLTCAPPRKSCPGGGGVDCNGVITPFDGTCCPVNIPGNCTCLCNPL